MTTAERIRVAVFSWDRAHRATVRVRLLDPLRALERSGRTEVHFVSSFDSALPIDNLMAADLWVIHREFADRRLGGVVLEAARLLAMPLVFEIDDLLTHLPESNPLRKYFDRVAPDIVRAMDRADFVTASTPRLIEELARDLPAVKQKAFVIPNAVNTDVWGDRPMDRALGERDPLIVGWVGSATHEEDLSLVREAIRSLVARHGGRLEFHFFGYLPDDLKQQPGVRLVRGLVPDLEQHARSVRSATMHLALAPLVDNSFNHCKSDLKWLEYSICGVPGVYSDLTPYSSSVEEGQTGLLVGQDSGDWIGAIGRLIQDPALRARIAQNAFEAVHAARCLDSSASKWDELCRSAVATSRLGKSATPVGAAARRARELLLRLQARLRARNQANSP